MLTARQKTLLTYLSDQVRTTGITPSYGEMCLALGLGSKAGIARLVDGLVQRGFVRKTPGRARSLEILRHPQEVNDNLAVDVSMKVVPVMGKIAAGTPIDAIQVQISTITVPTAMVGDGQHYALQVKGDSMVEAGISDGDTVLIRQQDDCETGSIAVALVDGQFATLKRVRKAPRTITLEPANSAHEPVTYRQHRVTIQGKLIGLLRAY